MKCNQFPKLLSRLGILLLFISSIQLQAQQGKPFHQPDSVFGFNFTINMSKAVQDGIFNPDSGVVDVVLDHEINPIRLVPDGVFKYSGSITGLDSGAAYHYKYRINDTLWETVSRTATAVQGFTNLDDWWNNEVLNYTRFEINMGYQVSNGRFDPVSDHVFILGTMNEWQGSLPLQRTDTINYIYSITYSPDPMSVQEYKFRINGDSSGLELLNKPNRMLLIREGANQVVNDFDNFNPTRLPMTFNCNMKYFIAAGHFTEGSDFLDVAGSFNNWEGQDVLFDIANDSLYTATLFLDSALIHASPLEFKFRINGNWNTAELFDKPNRTYAFHDTASGNLNIFNCWYDDKNPSIPTPPWVYNVGIQGKIIHKNVISGYYSYENVNGIPEGISLYQWYQSDDSLGTVLSPIDSAFHINYTIDTTDIGKWLVFEVTPVAASGDSATGKPVRVITATKTGSVGMADLENIFTRVYPNPTNDVLFIEADIEIATLELFGYNGIRLMNISGIHQKQTRIDIRSIPPGLYLLKAYGKNKETGIVKVMKH